MSSRKGHSLIELVIAMTVLVMGTGAIVVAFLSSSSLSQSNRETAMALDAVQGTLERIKGEEFAEAFARYNEDPLDNPPLGPSPGNVFAVRGLEAQVGDPDGLVGEILFPGDGFELREDVVDLDLGMSRDLNDDGMVDGNDHGDDYVILPVRVIVRWRGSDGDRELELVTTITGG